MFAPVPQLTGSWKTAAWTIESPRDGKVYHSASHTAPASLAYGAVTDDLNAVFVSTGGAAGIQDVEWARRMGRQAFFSSADAQCTIAAAP